MQVSLRASAALLAASLSFHAGAAEAPVPAASAASAVNACQAPAADRAADNACAAAFARDAERERGAGHGDAALAMLARADQFAPEELRFATARAGLSLQLAGKLSPAGIEAAALAAPDDVGLAMMHAELSLAKKDYAAALADLDRVVARRPDAAPAWEMRASVDVLKPDFEAARADVDHALRLAPKSPGALRLRGVLRNNAGDHAGALADYQDAHALAPRPEDPFVIGSTLFLQRRFGDAAETLATRPPATPDGLYWRLWRYLALARLDGATRADGALGPGTPPGAGRPWPGPVIDFLHGHIGAAPLLAAAKKLQDADDQSQVCEAHFYMGEDALLRRRGDAVELFRQAVRECPINFHEYEGATAELRAMGVSPTQPGPTVAAAAAAAASATLAASAAR